VSLPFSTSFYVHISFVHRDRPVRQHTAREDKERRREEDHRAQQEFETEYEWYCDSEIDRFIATLDPAEVATVLAAKRQEMSEKYKTPWMIDEFAKQESRFELAKRVPLMTIEEFKTHHEQTTDLAAIQKVAAPSGEAVDSALNDDTDESARPTTDCEPTPDELGEPPFDADLLREAA
jgi:hypothetical protein